VDCIDPTNKVFVAQIVALFDTFVKIHYCGFSTNFDENMPLVANRILKQ